MLVSPLYYKPSVNMESVKRLGPYFRRLSFGYMQHPTCACTPPQRSRHHERAPRAVLLAIENRGGSLMRRNAFGGTASTPLSTMGFTYYVFALPHTAADAASSRPGARHAARRSRLASGSAAEWPPFVALRYSELLEFSRAGRSLYPSLARLLPSFPGRYAPGCHTRANLRRRGAALETWLGALCAACQAPTAADGGGAASRAAPQGTPSRAPPGGARAGANHAMDAVRIVLSVTLATAECEAPPASPARGSSYVTTPSGGTGAKGRAAQGEGAVDGAAVHRRARRRSGLLSSFDAVAEGGDAGVLAGADAAATFRTCEPPTDVASRAGGVPTSASDGSASHPTPPAAARMPSSPPPRIGRSDSPVVLAPGDNDMFTPERQLPTPGQCGHIPQRHTPAGTAAPTIIDKGNTVPQRANPTQTAYASSSPLRLVDRVNPNPPSRDPPATVRATRNCERLASDIADESAHFRRTSKAFSIRRVSPLPFVFRPVSAPAAAAAATGRWVYRSADRRNLLLGLAASAAAVLGATLTQLLAALACLFLAVKLLVLGNLAGRGVNSSTWSLLHTHCGARGV